MRSNKWIEGISNVQLYEGEEGKETTSFPLLTFTFNRLLVIHDGKILTPTKQWHIVHRDDGYKEIRLTPPLLGEVVVYYI